MEYHVFNDIIVSFENSVFVRKFCNVMRSLWVIRSKCFKNHSVLLFLSQILLLKSWHDLVVDAKKFIIILKIVRNLFIDNFSLWSFLKFNYVRNYPQSYKMKLPKPAQTLISEIIAKQSLNFYCLVKQELISLGKLVK